MENSKKGYTPMIEKPDYRKSQGAKTPSEVRFQQNPGETYWIVVKTILKYLRNTKDMVLVYREKPEAELKVSCYDKFSFQTDKKVHTDDNVADPFTKPMPLNKHFEHALAIGIVHARSLM
ncbi:hypothetical protein Tco_0560689 [Tanacetum coccineum]